MKFRRSYKFRIYVCEKTLSLHFLISVSRLMLLHDAKATLLRLFYQYYRVLEVNNILCEASCM